MFIPQRKKQKNEETKQTNHYKFNFYGIVYFVCMFNYVKLSLFYFMFIFIFIYKIYVIFNFPLKQYYNIKKQRTENQLLNICMYVCRKKETKTNERTNKSLENQINKLTSYLFLVKCHVFLFLFYVLCFV